MTTSHSVQSMPNLATSTTIEDQAIFLPLMMYDVFKAGKSVIEGRTFRNCRIEGPAVLLATDGVNFDGCDLGYTGGDIRNLLLSPRGASVIGAIPVQNCRFINCQFFAVGYTGSQTWLDEIERALGTGGGGAS